eukprot:TRINITY_DN2266_c0_g2_i1.p1 TRINITY_DN2266_c0_g2~~TRINITY_DN2266_c0_g2_i1.p1  ORF type:complete len:143 (-),score=53.24 TRINITY_DN2266_c0_g2_i1:387-815(-)
MAINTTLRVTIAALLLLQSTIFAYNSIACTSDAECAFMGGDEVARAVCDGEVSECKLVARDHHPRLNERAVDVKGNATNGTYYYYTYEYYYSFPPNPTVSTGDWISASFGWLMLFILVVLIIAACVYCTVYRIMHRNDDEDE